VVLNVVYALLTEGLDRDEREQFDNDLWAGGAWEELNTSVLDQIAAIGDAGEGSVPINLQEV
jgi:hypothetical protein